MYVARVVYARGAGPVHWLIKQWSDSAPARWSHAGVLLGDADIGGEVPPVVWHTRWFKGFHKSPLYSFLRAYHKDFEVVTYLVEKGPDEQEAWCKARDGRGYAYGTVIGRVFFLRSPEKEDHCSEVVENFLHDMGVVGGPRWRAGHHLVTPNVSFNNLCGTAR